MRVDVNVVVVLVVDVTVVAVVIVDGAAVGADVGGTVGAFVHNTVGGSVVPEPESEPESSSGGYVAHVGAVGCAVGVVGAIDVGASVVGTVGCAVGVVGASDVGTSVVGAVGVLVGAEVDGALVVGASVVAVGAIVVGAGDVGALVAEGALDAVGAKVSVGANESVGAADVVGAEESVGASVSPPPPPRLARSNMPSIGRPPPSISARAHSITVFLSTSLTRPSPSMTVFQLYAIVPCESTSPPSPIESLPRPRTVVPATVACGMTIKHNATTE